VNRQLRQLYMSQSEPKIVHEVEDFLYKDEVYRIVGAAMEVHRVMGPGFLEAVYQECLAKECRARGIPFAEFPRIKLVYKGDILDKEYVSDFLFFDMILAEIKALARCGPNEEAQIINALRASAKPLGLLINFGEPSLYWKRYANTRPKKTTELA
jgi:GxxExxY protein